MLFRYRLAIPSPVIAVEQGMKMAALVHLWLTIVSIASYVPFFGSWVMRSIATSLNGFAPGPGATQYIRVCVWCIRFLFCWQGAHPLT